jgi:Na+/proline symporter
VWQAGHAAGKFQLIDLSIDPKTTYTLWAGVVGGVALTLATHGTDQFLVQRLLSARSARAAQTGLILSGVIVFAQFTLFLAIGVMLWRYYQINPMTSALATNDAVLPTFVVTSLAHGAAGFIVAAIVAAALSPSINSMASTTVNDFYAKYVNPGADDATLMRISRAATIFWGVAQIAVALGAQWIRSVLDTGLGVLSLAAGPVLGAFLVGVLSKRVGGGHMLIGIAAGFAVLVPVWYFGMTGFTWYAFVGSSATAAVAHLAALASPAPRTATS